MGENGHMAIPSITAKTTDWKRAAKAVSERRAELDLTVRDCVARANSAISVETWSKLENPKGAQSMARRSLSAASRALGWSHDSIERILVGHEPVPHDHYPAGAQPEATELAYRLWATEKQLRDLLLRQDENEQQLEGFATRLEEVQSLVSELRDVLAGGSVSQLPARPGRRSGPGKN